MHVLFQLGSFSSGSISGGIDMDGQSFVMMYDGEFGRIKVNGKGEPEFLRLGEKKNEIRSKRYLFQN